MLISYRRLFWVDGCPSIYHIIEIDHVRFQENQGFSSCRTFQGFDPIQSCRSCWGHGDRFMRCPHDKLSEKVSLRFSLPPVSTLYWVLCFFGSVVTAGGLQLGIMELIKGKEEKGREGGRGGHRALKWGTWTPSQNPLGSREITTRVSYFKSLAFKVCHRKSFKEPEKKKRK